jgi:hypothetical protein
MGPAVLRRACHPEFRVPRRNGAATQPADVSTFTQYGKRLAPGHRPDDAPAYSEAGKAGKDPGHGTTGRRPELGHGTRRSLPAPGGRPG